MTTSDDTTFHLTRADWVKCALGLIVQGGLVLLSSYVAVNQRMSTVESELAHQRELFAVQLQNQAEAIGELKDEVRAMRLADMPANDRADHPRFARVLPGDGGRTGP